MYAADVTYGTNSEFGFDYLRDNMAPTLEECVQRDHAFAIVDEVDNILIDEARTPLIISGRPEQAADTYYTFARLAKQMVGRGDEAEAEVARRVARHLRGRARLRVRREAQDRRADRARGDEGREVPRRREPLRLRARHARQPPDPVAEGRVAVQARHRLRGDRRRGEDHRRVHRPHPRGPALVGRPPPGGRGEGGRRDPRGEPDAGDDHPAELLPPLRQARRDDRHRAHRGDRVHEDLRDAGGRGRRPTGRWSGTTTTTRSTRPRRASGRRWSTRSTSATSSGQPVLVGTISVEVSEMLSRRAHPRRDRARGPEREARVRPARGRDRRPGGPPRRGHDRHQHGRPRRRHQARRRPRAARADELRKLGVTPERRELGERARRAGRRFEAQTQGGGRQGARASAACSSAAPSATSRAGSTTSSAAAPAARATRASHASSSPPRTT